MACRRRSTGSGVTGATLSRPALPKHLFCSSVDGLREKSELLAGADGAVTRGVSGGATAWACCRHLHRGGRVPKAPARLRQSAQGKPAAFLSEIPQECRDLSGARTRKPNPNPLELPEDRSCQVCCPGQPASHRYAPRSLLVITQPPLSSVVPQRCDCFPLLIIRPCPGKRPAHKGHFATRAFENEIEVIYKVQLSFDKCIVLEPSLI